MSFNSTINTREEYNRILEHYITLLSITNRAQSEITNTQTQIHRRVQNIISAIRWLPLNDNSTTQNPLINELSSNRFSNYGFSNFTNSQTNTNNTFNPSSPTRNSRNNDNRSETSNNRRSNNRRQPPLSVGSNINPYSQNHTRNTNTNTTLPFRNIFVEFENRNIPAGFPGIFENVPVFPSPEQIDNATRIVEYQQIDTPINTSCPISMETFSPTQLVMQIRHCGHIFNSSQLYGWFRSNVRCPVCRHDVRETESSSQQNNNSSSNISNTTTDISNNNTPSNGSHRYVVSTPIQTQTTITSQPVGLMSFNTTLDNITGLNQPIELTQTSQSDNFSNLNELTELLVRSMITPSITSQNVQQTEPNRDSSNNTIPEDGDDTTSQLSQD